MKKAYLLFILALLPFVVNAKVEIDGIYYNLTSGDTNTAEVTSKSSGKYSGDIVIPASVTYDDVDYSVSSIGGAAFYGCSALTSVTIPNSVTSIGSSAFSQCSGLTSVTIPNSVTSIGNNAFSGCSSLTSVHISDLDAWCKISFTGVASNPLNWAHHLYLNGEEITDLVIPNSVTSIGQWAFYNCSGLTSVTIPNSVTSIGANNPFAGCDGLTKIVVEEGNTVYDSRDNCNAIIETQSNTLMTGCKNTTIPNSVTSIGVFAFWGCSGLTSVTIPNSVTSIGSAAFRDCSSLTSIKVEDGNTTYDSRDNCNAIIETQSNTLISGCKNTVIPNSVTTIGSSAFRDCSGLTSVTIPNSVIFIGSYAFSGCSGLTSLTIGNSVTTIGSSAFSGCSGLTSLTIGNSVTTIGSSAFQNCSKLTSVTIPNSVTGMGNYAFYGCRGLTSLTLPSSLTYIGEKVICGCSSLTSVICYAENIPETDVEALADFDMANAVLYVPTGSVEAYQAAEPWKNFKQIEGISNYDEIKLVSSGKGTWCSAYDLDFTNVKGLKAYITTGYDNETNTVWLTRINRVPAGTGLMLSGDPDGHYMVPHGTANTYCVNMLVGNYGEAYKIESTTGEYKNFVMKSGQFLAIGEGETATIGKNRAYLQIPSRIFAGTRSVNIGYDDDDGTTSINHISETAPQEEGVYYNLQGQRVDNPSKGLYIRNGKKVIVR